MVTRLVVIIKAWKAKKELAFLRYVEEELQGVL